MICPNQNDGDFGLSRSLNVKCNFVVDFLLVCNGKHMSITHDLGVQALGKSHLAKSLDNAKRIHSSSWVRGEATTKNKELNSFYADYHYNKPADQK